MSEFHDFGADAPPRTVGQFAEFLDALPSVPLHDRKCLPEPANGRLNDLGRVAMRLEVLPWDEARPDGGDWVRRTVARAARSHFDGDEGAVLALEPDELLAAVPEPKIKFRAVSPEEWAERVAEQVGPMTPDRVPFGAVLRAAELIHATHAHAVKRVESKPEDLSTEVVAALESLRPARTLAKILPLCGAELDALTVHANRVDGGTLGVRELNKMRAEVAETHRMTGTDVDALRLAEFVRRLDPVKAPTLEGQKIDGERGSGDAKPGKGMPKVYPSGAPVPKGRHTRILSMIEAARYSGCCGGDRDDDKTATKRLNVLIKAKTIRLDRTNRKLCQLCIDDVPEQYRDMVEPKVEPKKPRDRRR